MNTRMLPYILALILISTVLTSCSPIAIYEYSEDNIEATLKLYPTNRYAYVEYNNAERISAKGDYSIKDSLFTLIYPYESRMTFNLGSETISSSPSTNGKQNIKLVSKKSESLLAFASLAFYDAQKVLISGTDFDINGEVSVHMPPETKTIQMSYTGHSTMTIDIADFLNKDLTIALAEAKLGGRLQGSCLVVLVDFVLEGNLTAKGLDLYDRHFTVLESKTAK